MKVALLEEFRLSRPSKQRFGWIQITPSRDSAFTEGTMDTISLTSRVKLWPTLLLSLLSSHFTSLTAP